MILFGWQGRGFWVPIIAAIAMFTPLIILRQVDGEQVDVGVAITMAIAGVVTLALGFIWNRPTPKGEPALHAFCRIPMQYWAVPMLVFSLLLATGILNTAEESPAPQSAAVTAQAFGQDFLS